MVTSKEDVSIENLAQGSVAARINLALEEAIRNCLNPNYDTSARKVKVTLEVKPNSRRDEVIIVPKVSAEKGKLILPGIAASIGLDSSGKSVAREFVDPQQQLFENNVTPIRTAMPAGQE